MEDVIQYFYHTLYRFQHCRPRPEQHGDLTQVEAYMLFGIFKMIEDAGDQDDKPLQIRVGDIIRNTGMSTTAVSKKIRNLEHKGMLVRTASKADRRNVEISLTEQGRQVYQQEKEKKQMRLERTIQEMGQENVKQMLTLVNQMLDVMQKLDEEEKGKESE